MVAFSVIGRAMSWMLGKLDRGYYFLGFGRQGLMFFDDGYGDLEKTIRLVQYRGARSAAIADTWFVCTCLRHLRL